MNLCINARDAMEGKGTLLISLGTVAPRVACAAPVISLSRAGS